MSQSVQQSSSVLVAGLALFSMFFGAGDLIWPLILGGSAGEQNTYATLGLLVSGVSLPLLGLIAMMLFHGNYHAFFGQIGAAPARIVIFLVQAILGPVGSIPRLMTLSYATLKPYLIADMSLFTFSALACGVVFAFAIRPQKIVQVLGAFLTPLLLLCLCTIVGIGFYHHPQPQPVVFGQAQAFSHGLLVGYNTLDLIASFIFAPLVLAHFTTGNNDSQSQRLVFKKVIKASVLAASLLSAMYVGLVFIASYYTPLLNVAHRPEERLSAIALFLLGPQGAFLACIAVSLACLTTAIPLVSVFARYIRDDLLGNKEGELGPILITLAISLIISNLGFMGIAQMLSPILQILCPSLIVLSLLNVSHKLYGTRVSRLAIFITFMFAVIGYAL